MIATCFAFIAFAASVVVGAFVGNELHTIVWRAVVSMFGCYLIGLAIGRIAQWTVDDHIVRYQQANPIPKEPDAAAAEASAPTRAAA